MSTVFAYPCTKGQKTIGKVMSERMISELVKILSPEKNIKLSNYEFVLGGYYFKIDTEIPPETLYLYYYTSSQGVTPDEDFFPELYVDDNGECLFTSQPSPLPLDCDEHSVSYASIKSLQDAWCPFYIAETYDSEKTNKIWIKESTMNPFVYNGSSWVPLGAVYKQTP